MVGDRVLISLQTGASPAEVLKGRWLKSRRKPTSHNLMVKEISDKMPLLQGETHAVRMKRILAKVREMKQDPMRIAEYMRKQDQYDRKRQRHQLEEQTSTPKKTEGSHHLPFCRDLRVVVSVLQYPAISAFKVL